MNYQKYNQTLKGEKEGLWINYEFIDKEREGGGLWHGDKQYGLHHSDTVYRPLNPQEYPAMEIIIKNDSTIKVDGWKSFTYISKIITNVIPKNLFYIKSVGRYENGSRKGKWIFYNEYDEIVKEIDFL